MFTCERKPGNVLPTTGPLTWRKSKACSNAACIEIAEQSSSFLMRDSKEARGPMLTFSRADWGNFIAGIRDNALKRE
jgi:hypothetical protein